MQDQFKACHQGCRRLESSLDTEGEHSAESVLEILAAEFVIRIALEARVVDAFHCRVLLKELSHCKSVLTAAFSSERKGLKSLEHEEGIER